MNRLSLTAMSFGGFGFLPIAGAGVADAGRIIADTDNTCARLAHDVPHVERSDSERAERRADA